MKRTDIKILDGRTESLLTTLSNNDNEFCPYFNDVLDETLNGDFTLEFSVPMSHISSSHIREGNLVLLKDLDNVFQLFQIYKTEEIHEEETKELKAYCEHAVYETMDDIVTDLRVNNGTPAEAMQKALNGSRWSAGVVDTLPNSTVNFYYTSGRENIMKVANAFGGEIRYRIIVNGNTITNRHVDLLFRRGADTGNRFEFNKDLTSVKRTVEADGLKTALYGRGSGEEIEETGGYTRKVTIADAVWSTATGDPIDKPLGQEWVGIESAKTNFGRANGTRHRYGVFDYESTDPQEILEKTYEQLLAVSTPRVTYECKVIDLEKLEGMSHKKVRLGDTVFVIDKDLGMRIEARVVQVKSPIDANTENTEIVLGNFIENIADYNAKLKEVIATVTDRKGVWDKGADAGGGIDEVRDSNIYSPVPTVPTNVSATGLFKSVILSWTFNPSVSISAYEVYASRVQGFTVDPTNLVFRGKVGGYVHQADTNETWYFRVRAINPQGVASGYTQEFSASTIKVANADYELLSITDAIIHSVSADKLTAGEIDANIIDVINLNAGNITAGILDAQRVRIGSTTTFQSGYDPSTKATPQNVATAKQEAITSAQSYAEAKAESERVLAEAYADGLIDAEEQARINDVLAKLQQAKTYADTKKQEAIAEGVSYTDLTVRNIEISGRNLIRNSGFRENFDYWDGHVDLFTLIDPEADKSTSKIATVNVSGLTSAQWLALFTDPVSAQPNEEYTFSVDFKVTNQADWTIKIPFTVEYHNASLTRVQYHDVTLTDLGISTMPNNTWVRGHFTLKGTDPNIKYALIRLSLAQNGEIFFREAKIERGNKPTEWTPAIEDTVQEINLIADRVAMVDLRTTEDSIIGTVTNSESYLNEMMGKANTSDLSEFASLSDLSEVRADISDEIQGKIYAIDFTPYVTQSELIQTADALDVKFSSSGGVNLIKNSVGFAGTDFWTKTGTVTAIQNLELEQRGTGSGFEFNNGTLTQTISVIPNMTYTLSTLVYKGATGTGYFQVMYDGTLQLNHNLVAGVVNEYERISFTFTPTQSEITVTMNGGASSFALFTGTMLNIGLVPLQWQHSSGEVYNTNVLMNQNGIKVISNQYNGYTSITPQEFSGYAEVGGQMKKVFTLNKDVTEMSKVKVQQEFEMGNVKIVDILGGWAFI